MTLRVVVYHFFKRMRTWAPLLMLAALCTANADIMIEGGWGSCSPGLAPEQSCFFIEQQNFVLPSDVSVNISVPGDYLSESTLTPGIIAAGTLVDSYYIHLLVAGGQVLRFDKPILGVIVLHDELAASNVIFSSPELVYSDIGLELENSTELSIVDETLLCNSSTYSATSLGNARIVTVATPEPAGSMLFFTCVLYYGLLRKRRARSGKQGSTKVTRCGSVIL